MQTMNRFILIVLYVCVICAVKGSSSLYKVKRKNSSEEKVLQDFIGGNDSRVRRHAQKLRPAYLLFDNRNERTVQLMWRFSNNETERWKNFKQLKPGRTTRLMSYDVHEWKAVEIKERKSLTINNMTINNMTINNMTINNMTINNMMINNMTIFKPEANSIKTQTVCIIKHPDQSEDDIVIKKFVETLVVVDKSVRNRFDNESEAERYVKVLFSLASRVFYHSNLTQHGLEIFIIPSKIVFHTDEIKFNIRSWKITLTRACRRLNEIAKNEERRYDHMLFMTKKRFGAKGLAIRRVMCSQSKSCSMVFDIGFSSTTLIAHEIAHALGVSHVTLKQFTPFVMASYSFGSFNNHIWSYKSLSSLLFYRNQFSCLDNEPNVTAHNNETYERPGIYFSFEKQCNLEYDVLEAQTSWTTTKIPSRDPCENLRCKFPGFNSLLVRKTGLPALDGTHCGDNKWCISGKCQEKIPSNHTTTSEIMGKV